MRGLLRITSLRVPYLRAGLSWPTREPVELHVSELDAARFRELLTDPVLTVFVSDDDGGFHKPPEGAVDVPDETLQLMIDSLAEFAPAEPIADSAGDLAALQAQYDQVNGDLLEARTEIERLLAIEAAWKADQRHLHDQGFQTLDALTSAWAVDRAKINAVEAEAKPAAKARAKPAAQ